MLGLPSETAARREVQPESLFGTLGSVSGWARSICAIILASSLSRITAAWRAAIFCSWRLQ